MPIIEEEDLKNLHKEIEFQKNIINDLNEDIEEISSTNGELEKHRLLLGIISGVLLLLLLLGLGTYFLSPNIFISKSSLEKQGYKIMTTGEFQQIQEILNSKEITPSATDEFSDQDIAKNEDQESIKGTLVYAVQIKALETRGIELYSNNLIQFAEIYKDDFYKYALGAFETLEEAQGFRKEIVRLGFKDAFIASYKNGKRLRIEEAY